MTAILELNPNPTESPQRINGTDNWDNKQITVGCGGRNGSIAEKIILEPGDRYILAQFNGTGFEISRFQKPNPKDNNA